MTKRRFFPVLRIYESIPLVLWAVIANRPLLAMLQKVIPPTPTPPPKGQVPAAAKENSDPSTASGVGDSDDADQRSTGQKAE